MQQMELTTWASFKSLVATKGLAIQYTENTNTYDLFGPEAGSFMWHYTMLMDGGSDQTDFETNFKPTANAPLEIKAGAGRPMRVSASPQPDNTIEHWKGYQLTIPAGQTSAYVDVSFSSTVYLHGGYIVSADVDFDDYVQADILIAANNAMYVPGIVSTAYMIPNLPVSFESAESMVFPTSVKIRVTLNTANADATDTHANILVNYFV